MALTAQKANELRQRQLAKNQSKVPVNATERQTKVDSYVSANKNAPINRFGSATPAPNTGMQTTKNNNFNTFAQQRAEGLNPVSFNAPEAGSTIDQQRQFSRDISNQFGAPSGVPDSGVSAAERARRLQASDTNLGVGQNAAGSITLGRDSDAIPQGASYFGNTDEFTTVQEAQIGAQRVAEQRQADFFEQSAIKLGRKPLPNSAGIGQGLLYLDPDTGQPLEVSSQDPKTRQIASTAAKYGLSMAEATDLYDQAASQGVLTGQDQQQINDAEAGIRQRGFTGSSIANQAEAQALGDIIEGNKTPEELAKDKEREYNIRYGEDLNILDGDKAEALKDGTAAILGRLGVSGSIEDASSSTKRLYALAVENLEKKVGKSYDDAKENLDLGLARSERKYVSQVEQAREQARQKAFEDSQKTPADLDREELELFIAQEQAIDPSQTRAYLENKWKGINKYEEIDPNAKANISTWETMMARGELDVGNQSKTFAQALQLTGDADKAEALLKTTGDAATAKEFRGAWTEEKYGTAALTRQNAISWVNTMYSGEEKSADAIDAFVEEAKANFDDVFIASQLEDIAGSYGADPLVKQVAQDYLDAEYGKYLDKPENADLPSTNEMEARYLSGTMTREEETKYEQGRVKLANLKASVEKSTPENIEKQTLAKEVASGMVEKYKSGEMDYSEAITKLPNEESKAEFIKQVSQGDVSKAVKEDSGAIQTIDRQVSSIDELLKDNNYQLISGLSRGGLDIKARIGGRKDNAIASVRTLVSTQTLDALINAKADGATFGALSNEELKMLQNSASSLAGMLDRDKNDNIIGFIGTEERVKTELQNLNNALKITKFKKTGEMPQGILNLNEGAFNSFTPEDADRFENVFKENALDVIEAINEKGFEPADILDYYDPLGKPQASISGAVTGLGSKFWKHGLDVVVDGGYDAPIPSPISGKVVTVVSDFEGDPNSPLSDEISKDQNNMWGNQVKVVDDEGNEHWFSHLAGSDLQEGQTIAAGDIIGRQGNTGRTFSQSGGSGAHLDYTIQKPDKTYLTPQEVRKIAGLNNTEV